MTTKYYIAGPMTGIPQFNFPAFFDAAADLRAQGYEIVSPAEMDMEIGVTALASPDGKLKEGKTSDGYTFGDFLARDVKVIADIVDGVCVLPDWVKSKGARLEVFVALISGKPVVEYVPGKTPVPLDFHKLAETVKPQQYHFAEYQQRAYGK